ncbi:MAG: ABC transporter substrate-binding protein, partial [Chloroflexi bacterium]
MFRKLLLAFLIVPLLAACSPTDSSTPVAIATEPPATAVPSATAMPTAASISMTDGLGRTVTLSGPARRVVSLAPANTEILY